VVKFGEVVQQPPVLSVTPRQRGVNGTQVVQLLLLLLLLLIDR